MKFTQITPAQLAPRLRTSPAPILVDVRLAEDFAAAHLPGAKNNCVFEVAFLERMPAIAPDKQAAVCVYGAAPDSLEARMAAEKLCRAGYSNVMELPAGLEGCEGAAVPVQGDPTSAATRAPIIPDGVRLLDLAESRVEWTGRNLLNKHQGKIGLQSGSLRFAGGQLVGGEFVLDMRALTCDDLAGHALHDVLIGHLQSDDFFDVELYPEARFVITSATPKADARAGEPNLTVQGELTLKGVTRALEFVATAGVTDEGKPAAQGVVAFDRTQWNVLYGSGRLFRRLAGHLVNSFIELQLRIVTQ